MPTPNLLKVLEMVETALRSGKLPLGTDLTEGTIAKVLNINRTTTRLILRIITKIQQTMPPLTYAPPRDPQRSSVIFEETPQSTRISPIEIYAAPVQEISPRNDYPQEMNIPLARKKKESSGTPDDAPVVVRPVVSSSSTSHSLDVVRCPGCGFLIPAKEVRSSLHATGTASCPKCQGDLSDVIGGTTVD